MKAKSSAPGKVILFGEHAVVYGEPALSLAVDRRITCNISTANLETSVNGYPINKEHHSYILECINKIDTDKKFKIETESNLPSGAGMGSSAAVTVSTLGCLRELLSKDLEEEKIAKDAFEVEFKVQGNASPIDTSTSTHGNAIMISKEKKEDFLWKIKKDKNIWNIHHQDIPDIDLVIGDSGVHSSTGPLVEKVRKFYEKSNFAKEIIQDIGDIVRKATDQLKNQDLEEVGRLMDKNHRLLSILGVSHPKLEKLIRGARKYSYGAKLTGAGGGGAMIALTDEAEKVAEEIDRRGGTPYIIKSTKKGLVTST
ncbi:MAG: mevalonate kinase [Candidatus Thermoplasmatota archaeon]|nr:mevalonate kinase [Candidatus Thermoplasmatota archaeon]